MVNVFHLVYDGKEVNYLIFFYNRLDQDQTLCEYYNSIQNKSRHRPKLSTYLQELTHSVNYNLNNNS